MRNSFLKPTLIIAAVLLMSFLQNISYAQPADSVDDIEISPAMDINRFSPYKFYSSISGNPDSVNLEISGINGDGSNTIDYYLDGTPKTKTWLKTMVYNSTLGKWESPYVYPDALYPEIFFEDSSLNWFFAPINLILQRNTYQLMHFTNPYSMVGGDMTFFIEVNAAPRAANSSDLQVYLVKKGKNKSFFESDWRNSTDLELVGSISSTDAVDHIHTDNSSHHLVKLLTNADGTVGLNHLDISGDFWVVLYTQSPNNARGWDFRYHPNCNDRGRWFEGSQAGWTIKNLAGCADTHVHLARRSGKIDGDTAKVTANFGGVPISNSESFYFSPAPNLPPNPTMFTSPLVGGIYNGNGTDQINISWNPANDPNNDPLLYSIYLLDQNNNILSTIVSNTSNTSYTWDISSIANGDYKLKGVITENLANPLSTEFFMEGLFTINKPLPTYLLNSINISSNNTTSTLAKAGDQITLSFTATGAINSPSVTLYSGGNTVTGPVTITNTGGNNWTAKYNVNSLDTEGQVAFTIESSNLANIYSETTDNSSVYVDLSNPDSVIANPTGGTYSSAQNVTLSSVNSDYIKYSIDNSTPSCSSGITYAGPVSVSSPLVIKAVSCDNAGNHSNVTTFNYAFQYTLNFDGNGGSGQDPTTMQVNHGNTVTLPTPPQRTGYTFTGWNTEMNGSGSNFDASTTVTGNLTLYAQWTINNYSITYYGNSQNSGAAPAPENYDFGSTAVIKNQNTLAKTGYTFHGWNTAANGSGISYLAGDNLTVAGNIDLYAQWSENAKCTVFFDGNGGTGHMPGQQTVDCGTTLVAGGKNLPSQPVRSGYSFHEWNTLEDGMGSTFDVNSVINSNIVVYAVWTGNTYSLSFDSKGGSLVPSINVTFGNAVGALPVPLKEGYTFQSWNSANDGSGVTYTAVTVYSIAGGTTLFAQYTPNSYAITFDSTGGSPVPGKNVFYQTAVGALSIPTKTGFSFENWNSKSDGTGTIFTDSTVYSLSSDSTLYAQWKGNTYLLGFNSDEGSYSAAKEVTYNSPIGTLPIPTKTGYTFSGWYSESAGFGNLITSATIFEKTENTVIYAKWTPVNYTLNYTAGTGGTITGTTNQTVAYGNSGTNVTANAASGYSFVKWSDNKTANPRQDTNITGNINVTAIFEMINQPVSSSTGGGASSLLDNSYNYQDDTKSVLFTLKYTDVNQSKSFYEAVKYLTQKGIFKGYADNTFRPDIAINRAEITKIAVIASGADPDLKKYRNCFPDVTTEWFAPYVCYAKEKGWVHGYGSGEFKDQFRPERTVNRAEILKILMNTQNIKISALITQKPFLDVPTDAWFAPFAKQAKEMKVYSAKLFDPGKMMNRSESAEFLYRINKSAK